MLLLLSTHVPKTMVAPNPQAPTKPPSPMNIPSDSPPAVIEEIISGAPFAKASNVQPAIASLNLKISEYEIKTRSKNSL